MFCFLLPRCERLLCPGVSSPLLKPHARTGSLRRTFCVTVGVRRTGIFSGACRASTCHGARGAHSCHGVLHAGILCDTRRTSTCRRVGGARSSHGVRRTGIFMQHPAPALVCAHAAPALVMECDTQGTYMEYAQATLFEHAEPAPVREHAGILDGTRRTSTFRGVPRARSCHGARRTGTLREHAAPAPVFVHAAPALVVEVRQGSHAACDALFRHSSGPCDCWWPAASASQRRRRIRPIMPRSFFAF